MSNTYRRPTSNPHSKFGAAARPSPRPERSVREGRSSYDVSLSPPSSPLHNSGTAIAEEFRDFIEEYDLRTEGASGFGPMLSDSPLEGGRSTQPKKRRRTRDAGLQVGEKDSVVAIDGNKPPSQRLVLLVANLIPITSTTRRTRNVNSREKQPREVMLFIPEHIIRKVPKYESELDDQMASVEDKGQTFEISDPTTHHQVSLVRAIEYISGARLPSIDASESNDNVQRTLTELLGVYAVSIALEIKTLEDCVLAHIESCPDLSTEAFLAFARTFYAGDVDKGLAAHATDSSIGKMIKRRLAVLLPRLLHDGTVRTIKAEGGTLSNELLEVIIDHCSGKEGIKVED